MKLILIRHATTDHNLNHRVQGHKDVPLNSLGKQEAQELAKALVNLGITRIVSSDSKRASETAEIINTFLRVPLQVDPRLRECSFGKIEGLTLEEATKEYGEPASIAWQKKYDYYDFRSMGGEHRELVLNRHLEFLNSLLVDNPQEVVLLVGHGRGLNTLLLNLKYEPSLKRGEYRTIEYK